MRYCLIMIALLLAGCSNEKTKKTFKGPQGIVAEISETKYGASAPNDIRVDLVSKNRRDRITIFNGTDGSQPSIIFINKIIIIQYCYPTAYDIKGYVYSVGDDYAYSDIRIAAATVESTIDGMRFCQGGMAG